MYLALNSGNSEAISRYIQDGGTPLMYAAEDGLVYYIKKLLDAKADVHAVAKVRCVYLESCDDLIDRTERPRCR
jgi:hypothetical protein